MREVVELIDHNLELRALDLESLHGLRQLALRLCQRRLLGCHDLGHAVVALHGEHPFAQALGCRRGLGNHLRSEVRIILELSADLGDDLGLDFVLIVALERVEQRA